MEDPRTRRLQIDLEKGGVYSGGQTLKGVVKLELDENVEMVGVELKVYGGAFVKWTEHKDDLERTEIEQSAEEIYFNDNFILWGQGRSTPAAVEILEIGRHLFPFNVYLRPDIPCSYEGPYGSVRYHVEAVLQTIEDQAPLRTKTCFAVIRDLDLSLVSPSKADLFREKEFLLHSTCCKAGRIMASLRISKLCFVPGERIHIDTDISNLAPRRIKNTALALRQVVKYGSDSHKLHKVSLEFRRVPGDWIKPGKRQCWTSRAIEVPVVTPSNLDGCKFIDIQYEVTLLIDLSPTVLTLSIPIIIGSIPVSGSTFASCTYKAQFLPPNHRIHWDVAPEGNALCVAENQAEFSPRYRYYSFQTPTAKIIALQQSPNARRRRYLVLGDSSLQESTV